MIEKNIKKEKLIILNETIEKDILQKNVILDNKMTNMIEQHMSNKKEILDNINDVKNTIEKLKEIYKIKEINKMENILLHISTFVYMFYLHNKNQTDFNSKMDEFNEKNPNEDYYDFQFYSIL